MEYKADAFLKASGYIPPRDQWTPVDEALYPHELVLSVDAEKAEGLRLNAVKHSVAKWYTGCSWYRRYCREFDFDPATIKTTEDIARVPLVSHRFFKTYPEGPEFAGWLSQLALDGFPAPEIGKKNPSIDDVIEAYASTGLQAVYSSGTSGRFSFIPKDQTTLNRSQYLICKLTVGEFWREWYDPEGYTYLLGPNPAKTNLWVGKVVYPLPRVFKDTRYAIDSEITTQMMRLSQGDARGVGEKAMMAVMPIITASRRIVPTIINWLAEREKKKDKIFLCEAPFLLQRVMAELKEQGRSFDFGERGAIVTGGGWKNNEAEKLPHDEFRRNVNDTLGIPAHMIVDLYTMCESNWHAIQCPEGHYFHLPQTVVYPIVLDENMKLLPYGESGRFAFVDSLANSYPGAVVTGDIVKLHDHCPVCGRPGPVLEHDVHRATGEEMRGCAEEVRRLMDSDGSEMIHDMVCAPDRSRMPLMIMKKREG